MLQFHPFTSSGGPKMQDAVGTWKFDSSPIVATFASDKSSKSGE